jgi:hypothetical protein
MKRSAIRTGVALVSGSSVLASCLFGDCALARNRQVIEPVLVEITATLRDPDTQWIVFLCAVIYLLAFVVARSRPTHTRPQARDAAAYLIPPRLSFGSRASYPQ